MRRVVIERGVQAAAATLAPATKQRLKRAFAGLAATPFPNETSDEKRRLDFPEGREPVYRLKVGDHRAVFVVRDRQVRVLYMFHRSTGYAWLRELGLD